MGYNQHQSFYLRDRWIGKGLRAVKNNSRFFFEKDAFEKLGIGKNMVISLQHWLVSTKTVEIIGSGNTREMIFTDFGKWLLDNDPSLKYIDTIAMLHYNIASYDEPSTSWYWFFKEYKEHLIVKEDMLKQLSIWIQSRENRIVSENSIARDVDCLLKMYTLENETEDPEDVMRSPLSRLGLLVQENDNWYQNEMDLSKSSLLFIKYVLNQYSGRNNVYEVSLNSLINDGGLFGKLYNLSTSNIIQSLIALERDVFYPIRFTRTNNLDIIKLPKMTLEELLNQHKY